MIWHEDYLISEDLFEKKFVCNLNACKGGCCVEGDMGAPLEEGEDSKLQEVLPEVLPYMTTAGKKAVAEQGVSTIAYNELSTTLVNNRECVFTTFDDAGIAKCAVEQAFREGKTKWKKPISCELYPIRLQGVDKYTALNYDHWDICNPACDMGEKLGVKVFRFLKEPIIRKFGTKFYNDLEGINEALENGVEPEVQE